jgi:hypothetical protein
MGIKLGGAVVFDGAHKGTRAVVTFVRTTEGP